MYSSLEGSCSLPGDTSGESTANEVSDTALLKELMVKDKVIDVDVDDASMSSVTWSRYKVGKSFRRT